MNSHLLPGDTGWTDDKVLIADLSHLNTDVTRYVLRYFDADAGQAEPVSAEDEHVLGLKLTELGERLQCRAASRESDASAHGSITEGDTAQPRALEPSREPGVDNGP
jgi:hypothetical protein